MSEKTLETPTDIVNAIKYLGDKHYVSIIHSESCDAWGISPPRLNDKHFNKFEDALLAALIAVAT